MIQSLFPRQEFASLDSLRLRVSQSRDDLLPPFDDLTLAFFGRLSELLFAANRNHGFAELQALAFWMRPAALKKMREQFLSSIPGNVVPTPRGISFHVTPSNVDTMPIYSLLLSLICGNSNVVRVSSRSGQQFQLVVDCIEQLLADDTSLRPLSKLITLLNYDRTRRDITDMLSQSCDTRVLWGGDAAITEIRQSVLPIDASEIVFPDRTSWAVIDAAFWNALSPDEKDKLLSQFFNDTLALDQLACSSPQLLVFVGEDQEREAASLNFWPLFEGRIAARGYTINASSSVDKLAAAWNWVMDQPAVKDVWRGSKLTVIKLNDWAPSGYPGCGSGFFYEMRCSQLADLGNQVSSRDQTLTYAGFDRDQVRSFIASLNGRGFTRCVPFGAALEFDHLWEGLDLLRSFTKLVHVR